MTRRFKTIQIINGTSPKFGLVNHIPLSAGLKLVRHPFIFTIGQGGGPLRGALHGPAPGACHQLFTNIDERFLLQHNKGKLLPVTSMSVCWNAVEDRGGIYCHQKSRRVWIFPPSFKVNVYWRWISSLKNIKIFSVGAFLVTSCALQLNK